jgi:chorismate dehydratase
MNKIRVSAISFYNTLPLVYGLRNSKVIDEIDLTLDTPAECANRLMSGSTDIGLVPVAVIPEIQNATIFSNYCISADGPARTVVLASEVPLEEIAEITLDHHSRTSIILAKIIFNEFWHLNVSYKPGFPGFENTEIKGNKAAVVIGDKVFAMEKRYKVVFDLAEVWRKFTGLPFVFACWVANRPLKEMFVKSFEEAMQFGIGHIKEASRTANLNGIRDYESIEHYLQNNIKYQLNDKKREAMKLFYQLAEKVDKGT